MTATSDGCASSTRGDEPQPPFLIADASHWQGAHPAWNLIEPHTVGIILKATQGLHYAPSWFLRHWEPVRAIGAERSVWLRGAYHYLDFFASGRKQADVYLGHVERAGGWAAGDIRPVLDVERGGGHRDASAQQVIECVEACADRIHERTGRRPILYGRGAMRDLAIRSMMGCVGVWNPSYTRTMVTNGLPCPIDDVVLWQYTDGSSGDASVHKLPLRLPGWVGGLDLSVYVDGARKPTIEGLVRRLVGPA